MSDIWDLFKQTESKAAAPMGKIEFVVAGLGNPGKEYAAKVPMPNHTEAMKYVVEETKNHPHSPTLSNILRR